MSTRIECTVNGQAHAFDARLTLTELIAHFGLHEKGVFIEHNREPLHRDDYARTRIADGDTIEIVAMMAGG